jgi:hypothetical protein
LLKKLYFFDDNKKIYFNNEENQWKNYDTSKKTAVTMDELTISSSDVKSFDEDKDLYKSKSNGNKIDKEHYEAYSFFYRNEIATTESSCFLFSNFFFNFFSICYFKIIILIFIFIICVLFILLL